MKLTYTFSIFILLLSAGLARAGEESVPSQSKPQAAADRTIEPEFVFVRAKYTNYPGIDGSGYGHGFTGTWRQWWETDFSDADRNLLRGLQRYTTMDASSKGYKAMSLTDPMLFEYPFLYINMKRVPLYSGNGPNFSPQEAAVLREYMMRGGFVMLDDFWGPEHWQDFRVELAKIFPDRRPQRLPIDHPIFHCFFDINEIKQVPGRGVTWGFGMGFVLDNADYPTAVHGVFDDQGRLMMTVNFNTDLGDGWEHTFDEFYPTRYCNAAYKIGINTIIYALSH
jgi:hypothetical protein